MTEHQLAHLVVVSVEQHLKTRVQTLQSCDLSGLLFLRKESPLESLLECVADVFGRGPACRNADNEVSFCVLGGHFPLLPDIQEEEEAMGGESGALKEPFFTSHFFIV